MLQTGVLHIGGGIGGRGPGRGGRRGRGRGGRPNNEEKRANDNAEQDLLASKIQDPEIRAAFLQFQSELDAKHDKHERLVKLSRDITIESKRIIFLLHRITTLDQPAKQDVLDEAHARLEALRAGPFQSVARELEGEDAHQFLRAYTAGLQEYIEALSLLNFLRQRALISWNECQLGLVYLNHKPPLADAEQVESADEAAAEARRIRVEVPLLDYLLGIGDIGGEAMRFALNSISAGDLEAPEHVEAFIARLHEGFALLRIRLGFSKDFTFKETVLKQSLEKVQDALYVLKLRGTEVPRHMLAHAVSALAAPPFHSDYAMNAC